VNRYFLKVNGEKHCPGGVCRPASAFEWEGGEVLIPATGPVRVVSGQFQDAPPIDAGDELWVWTHEDDQFGRGWGLTAKAHAGSARETGEFLAIELRDVERVARPFGYRALGDGPTGSSLLDQVRKSRAHRTYLLEDDAYRDFMALVESRAAELHDEVRYAGQSDWAGEIREHKEDVLRDLADRRLNWRKARPVQAEFRASLFDLYGGRCALTGCSVPEALEAAHVLPHTGDPFRDRPENGLLLRRDLHSMFDAMLWSIDPDNNKVRLSKQVTDRSFTAFEGKVIDHKVAPEPLRVHFIQFQKADTHV